MIYELEKIRWNVTRKFISENIPKNSDVLDIGGTCFYWDLEVYNVVTAGKWIESNFIIDIENEETLKTIQKKYDYVCMFEVLEHLRNPQLALKNIKSLMNPKCVFLGSTPNKRDPYYIIFRRKHKAHFNIYSRNELRKLFTDNEFEALSVDSKLMPIKLFGNTVLIADINPYIHAGRNLFWKCIAN